MFTAFIKEDKEWKAVDKAWKEKVDGELVKDKEWKSKDKAWKVKVEKEVSKIGFLYEDLVGRDLSKSKGVDFARKFKLRNLSGLSRLALPKNYYISDSTSATTIKSTENEVQVLRTEDWETSFLHQNRSRLLARAASKHIPDLQRWAHVTRSSTRTNGTTLHKLTILERALERFAECKSDAEAEEFLIFHPLGLYALSRETLADTAESKDQGFFQEYELDVRGESVFRNYIIMITAGESKSGAGRKQAILQLIKRLSILHCATQHLLTEEQLKLFTVSLQGVIYTKDSKWVSPDNAEISEIALENNIAISKEGLSIVVQHI